MIGRLITGRESALADKKGSHENFVAALNAGQGKMVGSMLEDCVAAIADYWLNLKKVTSKQD